MFISLWILIPVIVLLLVFIGIILYQWYRAYEAMCWFRDTARSCSDAYWLLLSSDAVDRETYEIHLPTSRYGEDRWIRKRTQEEIDENRK